jgi:hypothetical protein
MRFHMTHATLVYHRVRPISEPMVRFRRKLCTYLVSRLALSPNGSKQASTWTSSPSSTIGYVQNDFWACGIFGANLSCTDPNTISKQAETRIHMIPGTREFHRVHPKRFSILWVCSVQTVQLSCIKISTIPKWTKSSFQLSVITKEYHQVRPKWFMSLWYV